MRVLMLAQSPIAGDTRILREATTLRDAGHAVRVLGRDVPEGFVAPDGVTVDSVTGGGGLKRSSGNGASRSLGVVRRTARWALLPEHRREVERRWTQVAYDAVAAAPADVVHAHDFNTLAFASRLAGELSAALVYDTHEFWFGRPRVGRPTPLAHSRGRALEARLGRAADAVITVGAGVAERLRSAYGWTHVSVVRNTFPFRLRPAELPAEPTRLVYAGRLAPYRELEVIAAASRFVDLPVTLVGPADPAWLDRFDNGGALVLPAMSLPEVDQLISSAGLALITHSDRWVNHRLALPNKLFHAVSLGVPVVATDVGELGDMVRQYGLGTLYRPGDPSDLARAAQEAVGRYTELKEAVALAQSELSWERDAAELLRVYTAVNG